MIDLPESVQLLHSFANLLRYLQKPNPRVKLDAADCFFLDKEERRVRACIEELMVDAIMKDQDPRGEGEAR